MTKKKKKFMEKFITEMITDLGDDLFPKNTEELVDTVLELYPHIKGKEAELDILSTKAIDMIWWILLGICVGIYII